MATQVFKVHSKSQCYVESQSPLGKDTFYVNIDVKDEPHIKVIIEEHDSGSGPEKEAYYDFYGDSFQKVVNWLIESGMIK